MFHEAGGLGDDDDACVCLHADDFVVESRIDVFQDVKAMLEHKVDINVISIIVPGQGTEGKFVKRVLSETLLVSRGKRIPSMRVIWSRGLDWSSRKPLHHHWAQLQRRRQ